MVRDGRSMKLKESLKSLTSLPIRIGAIRLQGWRQKMLRFCAAISGILAFETFLLLYSHNFLYIFPIRRSFTLWANGVVKLRPNAEQVVVKLVSVQTKFNWFSATTYLARYFNGNKSDIIMLFTLDGLSKHILLLELSHKLSKNVSYNNPTTDKFQWQGQVRKCLQPHSDF